MSATRPAWAEVDVTAVALNVRAYAEAVAPAVVCAVVKADGYGHGAVPVAHAAVAGGAAWLAVATVEEGVELREAGIEAPVLLLSEPAAEAAETVVAHRLTPTVYTEVGIDTLAKAAAGSAHPLAVHLKVDTGMHRVGCRPDEACDLAAHVAAAAELELGGVLTHFAAADEPGHAFSAEQHERFDAVLADLRARGVDPGIVHACNSAAALTVPQARHDMVRIGISLYGIPAADELVGALRLVPVLALKARVTHVQRVPAGETVSYGVRYRVERDTTIVTVPIGYADGVPRELSFRGAEVLVGGRRCPIAGPITMDQFMVDVGDLPVAHGDEVVLIGRQGAEEITVREWSGLLGTIPNAIVSGIGPRVPRLLV